MKIQILAALVAAGDVAACTSAGNFPATPSAPTTAAPNSVASGSKKPLVIYSLSAAERQAVEAGVRSQLKDPMSATFDAVVAKNQEGNPNIIVCGLVNARNSFGGYAGNQMFQAFISSPRAGPTSSLSVQSVFMGNIAAMACENFV